MGSQHSQPGTEPVDNGLEITGSKSAHVSRPIVQAYVYVCSACGADYSTDGGRLLHQSVTHGANGPDPRTHATMRWVRVYRVRHCAHCDGIVYVRRPNARTLYVTPRAAAGIDR